ncbi:response regulator transcription factor [Mesosutterella sp. AGMB02718]|uniref:Response regulator transcription factor n=1 Tax=Mesosutterella faecium TaxID=2925194 RepID=A0ABT7IMD1_9BURK|nr:response regulator transcription factor [Mesosutterella sp. AGMB02718]MDL2059527.1 response regulator transcription factor [Mesosutterella sp. AGMB02718]
MPGSLKFIVVDDHSLITEALSALIRADSPSAEVYAANDVVSARRLLAEHGEEADLLILDLSMPGVVGTSLLEEFVKAHPSLKILVLSGLLDRRTVLGVLQKGAAGFVPKTLDAGLLTTAIHFVLKGGVYLPSRIIEESQRALFFDEASRAMREPAAAPQALTPRQMDVLRELAKGSPIKKICQTLGLSEGTVKTHVSAIYRALGARNRTEALIAAHRAGYDVRL